MKKKLLAIFIAVAYLSCLIGCTKRQETKENDNLSENSISDISTVSGDTSADTSESESSPHRAFPDNPEYDELIIGRWQADYENKIADFYFSEEGTGTLGISFVVIPFEWCTKDGTLYLKLIVGDMSDISSGPYEIIGNNLVILEEGGDGLVFSRPKTEESSDAPSEDSQTDSSDTEEPSDISKDVQIEKL